MQKQWTFTALQSRRRKSQETGGSLVTTATEKLGVTPLVFYFGVAAALLLVVAGSTVAALYSADVIGPNSQGASFRYVAAPPPPRPPPPSPPSPPPKPSPPRPPPLEKTLMHLSVLENSCGVKFLAIRFGNEQQVRPVYVRMVGGKCSTQINTDDAEYTIITTVSNPNLTAVVQRDASVPDDVRIEMAPSDVLGFKNGDLKCVAYTYNGQIADVTNPPVTDKWRVITVYYTGWEQNGILSPALTATDNLNVACFPPPSPPPAPNSPPLKIEVFTTDCGAKVLTVTNSLLNASTNEIYVHRSNVGSINDASCDPVGVDIPVALQPILMPQSTASVQDNSGLSLTYRVRDNQLEIEDINRFCKTYIINDKYKALQPTSPQKPNFITAETSIFEVVNNQKRQTIRESELDCILSPLTPPSPPSPPLPPMPPPLPPRPPPPPLPSPPPDGKCCCEQRDLSSDDISNVNHECGQFIKVEDDANTGEFLIDKNGEPSAIPTKTEAENFAANIQRMLNFCYQKCYENRGPVFNNHNGCKAFKVDPKCRTFKPSKDSGFTSWCGDGKNYDGLCYLFDANCAEKPNNADDDNYYAKDVEKSFTTNACTLAPNPVTGGVFAASSSCSSGSGNQTYRTCRLFSDPFKIHDLLITSPNTASDPFSTETVLNAATLSNNGVCDENSAYRQSDWNVKVVLSSGALRTIPIVCSTTTDHLDCCHAAQGASGRRRRLSESNHQGNYVTIGGRRYSEGIYLPIEHSELIDILTDPIVASVNVPAVIAHIFQKALDPSGSVVAQSCVDVTWLDLKDSCAGLNEFVCTNLAYVRFLGNVFARCSHNGAGCVRSSTSFTPCAR